MTKVQVDLFTGLVLICTMYGEEAKTKVFKAYITFSYLFLRMFLVDFIIVSLVFCSYSVAIGSVFL